MNRKESSRMAAPNASASSCPAADMTARHAQTAAKACRIIETADSPPTLQTLAAAVGLSPYHFHRLFKTALGVTPRQYAAALRTARAQSRLRGPASVTEAIYGAGFGSSSRFYERSAETLGMTPTEYRGGAPGVTIRFAIAPCPLGLVLVAGTGRGLCAIRFGHARTTLEDGLRRDFPKATIEKAGVEFASWVKAVVDQIRHPASRLDLPLDIRGTAFQQRVWQALREIPAGQTASYSQVAARIGQPSAVRAVARACATNPVAVVIPCHRVVGKDGALTGYRWGLDRKRRLLAAERNPPKPA